MTLNKLQGSYQTFISEIEHLGKHRLSSFEILLGVLEQNICERYWSVLKDLKRGNFDAPYALGFSHQVFP